jgi:hypothetical protein
MQPVRENVTLHVSSPAFVEFPHQGGIYEILLYSGFSISKALSGEIETTYIHLRKFDKGAGSHRDRLEKMNKRGRSAIN